MSAAFENLAACPPKATCLEEDKMIMGWDMVNPTMIITCRILIESIFENNYFHLGLNSYTLQLIIEEVFESKPFQLPSSLHCFQGAQTVQSLTSLELVWSTVRRVEYKLRVELEHSPSNFEQLAFENSCLEDCSNRQGLQFEEVFHSNEENLSNVHPFEWSTEGFERVCSVKTSNFERVYIQVEAVCQANQTKPLSFQMLGWSREGFEHV